MRVAPSQLNPFNFNKYSAQGEPLVNLRLTCPVKNFVFPQFELHSKAHITQVSSMLKLNTQPVFSFRPPFKE